LPKSFCHTEVFGFVVLIVLQGQKPLPAAEFPHCRAKKALHKNLKLHKKPTMHK